MHTSARLMFPALAMMLSACASHPESPATTASASPVLRVATYNTSLYDEDAVHTSPKMK